MGVWLKVCGEGHARGMRGWAAAYGCCDGSSSSRRMLSATRNCACVGDRCTTAMPNTSTNRTYNRHCVSAALLNLKHRWRTVGPATRSHANPCADRGCAAATSAPGLGSALRRAQQDPAEGSSRAASRWIGWLNTSLGSPALGSTRLPEPSGRQLSSSSDTVAKPSGCGRSSCRQTSRRTVAGFHGLSTVAGFHVMRAVAGFHVMRAVASHERVESWALTSTACTAGPSRLYKAS